MDFEDYVLPDGTIVPCDKTATKSAPVIDFTLAGGEIVKARRRYPVLIARRPPMQLERGPWQEAPRPSKGAHYHFCVMTGCETYLVCYAGDDTCGVENKWVCPSCELAAVDAYMSQQERKQQR